jgi:hypothetical protein
MLHRFSGQPPDTRIAAGGRPSGGPSERSTGDDKQMRR